MSNQSSRVASVSYRLVLDWSLKGRQLNQLYQQDSSNALVLRSDPYKFEALNGLSFCLEIRKSGNIDCEINAKGSEMWSFEVEHAFLASKDGAFSMKKSEQLSFLHPFLFTLVYQFPPEENITIRCVVNASCDHQGPSDQKGEAMFQPECLGATSTESMPDTTLPSDYKNQMAIDFIQKGIIPDLSVEKATEIISEIKKHKCEVLNMLCLQYATNFMNEKLLGDSEDGDSED